MDRGLGWLGWVFDVKTDFKFKMKISKIFRAYFVRVQPTKHRILLLQNFRKTSNSIKLSPIRDGIIFQKFQTKFLIELRLDQCGVIKMFVSSLNCQTCSWQTFRFLCRGEIIKYFRRCSLGEYFCNKRSLTLCAG